ncbi:MAG: nucleotidyltransferase family protein [Bdellovibrionota bacterium]
MPLSKVLQEKREEILRIATRHGARNVRVFGSFVRGEEKPTSDVDFLVDVGPEHSAWFPVSFKEDLEKALGRRVDVLTPRSIHPHIRDRVLAEAVAL